MSEIQRPGEDRDFKAPPDTKLPETAPEVLEKKVLTIAEFTSLDYISSEEAEFDHEISRLDSGSATLKPGEDAVKVRADLVREKGYHTSQRRAAQAFVGLTFRFISSIERILPNVKEKDATSKLTLEGLLSEVRLAVNGPGNFSEKGKLLKKVLASSKDKVNQMYDSSRFVISGSIETLAEQLNKLNPQVCTKIPEGLVF